MNKQHVDILRASILEKLRNLHPEAYPNITTYLSTRAGYEEIELLIIHYVRENDVSIGNAIAQLEMEL